MNLTINNQSITTQTGRTILDVAKENGIYIPTLCAHPELVSYGGCRLCIIELEGKKGYPTACTTLAEEGITIRTETQTIQEMRKDLIQLILSEHPSACLICEEIEGCTGFQDTIRKVGVTTGCRWCPKDKDCELQRVVEYLEVNELILPGLYRNLPLEKYDPFFDRDYNLCIYCGRCVRICTEFRKSNILSLKQRGKLTTIGPAFDENHIEAGCEFCGACVSVCPTGAMSEKSKKWWGVPESSEKSVCALCSLNCELEVLASKNKIIGTVPAGEPHQSGGKLCVKGRFCLSELINRTQRILEPEYKYPEGYGIVDWDFAIEKAKGILEELKPERSAMYLSPSLSLEEIHAANMFAEKVLKTNLVSSSCLNPDLVTYLELGSDGIREDHLQKADVIVSFFLNGNYKYAPVTISIKNAASNGTSFFQVGWIKDTTSRFAKRRYTPEKESPSSFINDLLSLLQNGNIKDTETSELAQALKNGKKNHFVVGPEILSFSNCERLLSSLKEIADLVDAKFLIVNQYGNLAGLLSLLNLKSQEEISRKINKGEIDVLYLVGDIPLNQRPNVKHIIYQNAFPAPAELAPDIIFPASVWGETGGTYLNADKKPKKFKAIASPHGYAMAHDMILSKLTKAMDIKGGLPKYKKINGVKLNLPAYPVKSFKKDSNPSKSPAYDKSYPFTLIQELDQHVYSSFSLGEELEGLNELVKPGYIHMHPADAKKKSLKEGDEVWISSYMEKKKFRITLRKNIEKGFLFLVTDGNKTEFENNPCSVKIRRQNV
jgi:predicted molibdopterin-dependent oxidoreductase YjgC